MHFYYAEKLLHELLRIYLEKILYQLVTSSKNQTLNELQYKFGSVYIQRYWLIFCHFYGTIWIHINEDTEHCLISRHLKNNNMSPHYFLLFTIHWCAKLSR